MARPRGRKADIRISVGFEERTYGALSAVAQENDATIAWVIRRAVAEYLSRRGSHLEPQLPLRRTSGTPKADTASEDRRR